MNFSRFFSQAKLNLLWYWDVEIFELALNSMFCKPTNEKIFLFYNP